MSARLKIGIIGAGLTGLTAARDLARAGHEVTVCEQAPEVGGLAGTFSYAGTRLEMFYHHSFTTDLETIRLIRELGLESRLQWRQTPMGIFKNGKCLAFASPLDLLRFTPLSFINRIRFGVVILYLSRVKRWQRYEHVFAEQWIRRAFGRQAWEVIWGPLLHGKFGEYASTIGMPWFYSRVHTRAGSREQGMTKESLGYLDGSFQVLLDALAKEIRNLRGTVRCGEKIASILSQDGRVRGWKTQRGEEETFDVVLATPAPPALQALLPAECRGSYWDKLRGVKYLGNVCAVLTVKRTLSPIYWMNVPDVASPFIAVIEHTNFIPSANYEGRHILYLSSYLPTDHPRYRAQDPELLQEFYTYLQKVIPSFTPQDVAEARVFRAPYAQPVVQAGYGDNLVSMASPLQGLFVATMAQIYPEDRGMSYSIRLGKQAAEMILAPARP